MDSWIWMLVGLAAGALIGGGVVWWWKRGAGVARTMAELQQENQRFKAEVTDHFVETARLINQLTDSYKAVFDHLSSAAQRLVDPEDLSARLSVEQREVRLHRIGASAPAAAAQRDVAPASAGASAGSARPASTGTGSKLGGGAAADAKSSSGASPGSAKTATPPAQPARARD